MRNISYVSQGRTTNCLNDHIEKLGKECAHQIFRISELQSDDCLLDRPLFYACRDDRERLCQYVLSGHGRVLDCLLSHKFDDMMSEECHKKLTSRYIFIS